VCCIKATETQVIIAGRMFSTIVIGIALWWGTMYPDLDMSKIVDWQNAILCQCVPSFVLGLYWRRASSRALIVGIVVGFWTAAVVEFGFVPAGIPTHVNSGLWATIVNAATVLFLQVYLPPYFLDDGKRDYDTLDKITMSFGPTRLTMEAIKNMLKGSQDPCSTRLGLAAVVGALVCIIFSVPFWNLSSEVVVGFPIWAWVMIFFQVGSVLFGLLAAWTWKPIGIPVGTFPSMDFSTEMETASDSIVHKRSNSGSSNLSSITSEMDRESIEYSGCNPAAEILQCI